MNSDTVSSNDEDQWSTESLEVDRSHTARSVVGTSSAEVDNGHQIYYDDDDDDYKAEHPEQDINLDDSKGPNEIVEIRSEKLDSQMPDSDHGTKSEFEIGDGFSETLEFSFREVSDRCRDILLKALQIAGYGKDEDAVIMRKAEFNLISSLTGSINHFLEIAARLQAVIDQLSSPILTEEWQAAVEKSKMEFKRIITKHTRQGILSHYPVLNFAVSGSQMCQLDASTSSIAPRASSTLDESQLFRLASKLLMQSKKIKTEGAEFPLASRYKQLLDVYLRTTERDCPDSQHKVAILQQSYNLVVSANQILLDTINSVMIDARSLSTGIGRMTKLQNRLARLRQSRAMRDSNQLADSRRNDELSGIENVAKTLSELQTSATVSDQYQATMQGLLKDFFLMMDTWQEKEGCRIKQIVSNSLPDIDTHIRRIKMPSLDAKDSGRKLQVKFIQNVLSMPSHVMPYLMHKFSFSIDGPGNPVSSTEEFKRPSKASREEELRAVKLDNYNLRNRISVLLAGYLDDKILRNITMYKQAQRLIFDIHNHFKPGTKLKTHIEDIIKTLQSVDTSSFDGSFQYRRHVKTMQRCAGILMVMMEGKQMEERQKLVKSSRSHRQNTAEERKSLTLQDRKSTQQPSLVTRKSGNRPKCGQKVIPMAKGHQLDYGDMQNIRSEMIDELHRKFPLIGDYFHECALLVPVSDQPHTNTDIS